VAEIERRPILSWLQKGAETVADGARALLREKGMLLKHELMQKGCQRRPKRRHKLSPRSKRSRLRRPSASGLRRRRRAKASATAS
jgi:hypothetical protein